MHELATHTPIHFCHFLEESQLEYNEAQERRRQLKEVHARLLEEEVAKMEEELAQEQPPVRQRDVLLFNILSAIRLSPGC